MAGAGAGRECRCCWMYAVSWRSMGTFLGASIGVLNLDRRAREAN
jgi:hypothetical protein